MKNLWAKFFARECLHEEVLVVRSVGVQRSVCESCGHLSFSIAPTVLVNADTPQTSASTQLPHAAGM